MRADCARVNHVSVSVPIQSWLSRGIVPRVECLGVADEWMWRTRLVQTSPQCDAISLNFIMITTLSLITMTLSLWWHDVFDVQLWSTQPDQLICLVFDQLNLATLTTPRPVWADTGSIWTVARPGSYRLAARFKAVRTAHLFLWQCLERPHMFWFWLSLLFVIINNGKSKGV